MKPPLSYGHPMTQKLSNPLHIVAENDTPAAVNVPSTWGGLIMWATGRFGSGILMAGAVAWALMQVYGDQKAMTDRVISAFEQQSANQRAMQLTLDAMTRSLEANTRGIEDAHRRVWPNDPTKR